MQVELAGKQILITGGTSALGREFVKCAQKEGATVFFTYHSNSEEAEKLMASGAKGFPVDLSKRSEIDELKEKIKTVTNKLDALVHNASIVKDRALSNLSVEEWDEVISVNLNAVYYLTKKFLPFLFHSPGSKILNVVSRVGLRGSFGQANYAAAKGGVIALTKTLAKELGRKKILVNALNPGFMKSKMTEIIPEDIFKQNIDESPLKVVSEPENVANFMVYLLSDHFQNVTGQIFHMDSRIVS